MPNIQIVGYSWKKTHELVGEQPAIPFAWQCSGDNKCHEHKGKLWTLRDLPNLSFLRGDAIVNQVNDKQNAANREKGVYRIKNSAASAIFCNQNKSRRSEHSDWINSEKRRELVYAHCKIYIALKNKVFGIDIINYVKNGKNEEDSVCGGETLPVFIPRSFDEFGNERKKNIKPNLDCNRPQHNIQRSCNICVDPKRLGKGQVGKKIL